MSLIKVLFHGTNKTDPLVIAKCQEGLDIKYARDGLYGRGIYFADNSQYSFNYSYLIPEGNEFSGCR